VAADSETIFAGGGLVWRPGGGASAFEVLLVHRPRYDDWSFPKGHRDPDETDEACALREVLEETGLRCVLGVELETVQYSDPQGRPKQVRYFAMQVESGDFLPNDEVDRICWLELAAARSRLSQPGDAGPLACLGSLLQGAVDV